MDFEDQKVIIMGLGLHGGGVGAAQYMVKEGADVVVTDLKQKSELESSLKKLNDYDLEFVLGKHREEDFEEADLVVKNPAVPWDSPYLELARENGVQIETAIGIFFKKVPCECIGITGTKGKSTTASLIFDILNKDRDRVFLAGNIGRQALNLLPKLNEDSVVVLELSSWQLEGLGREKISPHVSVVTNVFSDHLNRYQNFSDYKEAKKEIVSYQKEDDFAVLNYENKHTRDFAKDTNAEVVFFGTALAGDQHEEDKVASLEDGEIFYQGEKLLAQSKCSLQGAHNFLNILAALSCAAIYDIPPGLAREVLMDFEAPEGRLEFVAIKKGFKVYNDTASTNPRATIEAINTLKGTEQEHLFLIAGGVDKDLDYSSLADEIEKQVKHLFLLAGDASEKLNSNLSSNYKKKRTEKYFRDFEDLIQRVLKAKKRVAPNKKVKLLFSPGAASFNLFKNEFDRGRKFVAVIESL